MKRVIDEFHDNVASGEEWQYVSSFPIENQQAIRIITNKTVFEKWRSINVNGETGAYTQGNIRLKRLQFLNRKGFMRPSTTRLITSNNLNSASGITDLLVTASQPESRTNTIPRK